MPLLSPNSKPPIALGPGARPFPVVPDLLSQPFQQYSTRENRWYLPNTIPNLPTMEPLKRPLPTDVEEQIISCLYSESDRLSAMRVCKTWYHYVSLLPYQGFAVWNREGPYAVQMLFNRSAVFRRRLGVTRTLHIIQGLQDSPSYPRIVPLLLAKRMPNVDSITLHCCGVSRGNVCAEFTRRLSTFKNIVNLELSNFAFEECAKLQRIILACPRLETLVIINGTGALVPVRKSPTDAEVVCPSIPTQSGISRLRKVVLDHTTYRNWYSPLTKWLNLMAGTDLCHPVALYFTGKCRMPLPKIATFQPWARSRQSAQVPRCGEDIVAAISWELDHKAESMMFELKAAIVAHLRRHHDFSDTNLQQTLLCPWQSSARKHSSCGLMIEAPSTSLEHDSFPPFVKHIAAHLLSPRAKERVQYVCCLCGLRARTPTTLWRHVHGMHVF